MGTSWQHVRVIGYPFLVTDPTLSIAMDLIRSPLTNISTVLAKLLAKQSKAVNEFLHQLHQENAFQH